LMYLNCQGKACVDNIRLSHRAHDLSMLVWNTSI